MRRHSQVIAVFVALAGLPAMAVQASLDLPAVNEALLFSRTATVTERAQSNRPYRVVVGKAPVDYIDVITPYRRILLTGSARRSAGATLAQREALDLLKESGDTLDVSVELTFNPLNTYIDVPGYAVTLVGVDGRRVTALETFRSARWTARVEGPPSAAPASTGPRPTGGTMVGATIVGRFSLMSLNVTGNYEVETAVTGEPGVRAALPLAGMR
jgi:hypothetical protein